VNYAQQTRTAADAREHAQIAATKPTSMSTRDAGLDFSI
jgi:hypothetical protein